MTKINREHNHAPEEGLPLEFNSLHALSLIGKPEIYDSAIANISMVYIRSILRHLVGVDGQGIQSIKQLIDSLRRNGVISNVLGSLLEQLNYGRNCVCHQPELVFPRGTSDYLKTYREVMVMLRIIFIHEGIELDVSLGFTEDTRCTPPHTFPPPRMIGF